MAFVSMRSVMLPRGRRSPPGVSLGTNHRLHHDSSRGLSSRCLAVVGGLNNQPRSYSFVYNHSFSKRTLPTCRRRLGARTVRSGLGSA